MQRLRIQYTRESSATFAVSVIFGHDFVSIEHTRTHATPPIKSFYQRLTLADDKIEWAVNDYYFY